MFDCILIANRGEIACRIMQTAQALGVRCVAVHSDADAQSAHVFMADDAVSLGGNTPAESYLRGDAIIEAALASGAQAIHPGYGFLSENPDFVDAVEQAGLTFIGPSAKAIRAMGLKDAAKALMVKAGVPVVPGYHGADQSDTVLAEEADKIGYPVLIKAVAGGGGKGMRLVEQASDFKSALDSARSEAKTAFGNSDVLVEKFVTQPRHIEIQVFGDGQSAVHLFERDCSLQRRHQKVIEEAPAPFMTDDVRTAMGAAAVRAAEAIGYKGAGTIEFIVDGSSGLRTDGFWFMEMNTRLQVEHPVTEAITGIDLVEWQLRVAAGAPLPKSQDEITLVGHAFEARLYAEDVPKGFLPATGRLAHLAFPDAVRADTGVRTGDAISPYYDPMIAKVIVHGPDRGAALAQLRRGLARTQVVGTTTNLSFLHALASHEGFSRGDVDTGLIARDLDALIAVQPCSAADLAQAALWALDLGQPRSDSGFTLWAPLARQVVLAQDQTEYLCKCEVQSAKQANIETPLGNVRASYTAGRWTFDGKAAREAFASGDTIALFGPSTHVFSIIDPLKVATNTGGNKDVIEAPMPGLIKAVLVKKGQKVAIGAKLAVLEAMKMEHSLLSERNGVVAEVLAPEGAQVDAGAALIRLEEETPPE